VIANTQSPQSYNQYSYVANNAVSWTDPTGFVAGGTLISAAIVAGGILISAAIVVSVSAIVVSVGLFAVRQNEIAMCVNKEKLKQYEDYSEGKRQGNPDTDKIRTNCANRTMRNTIDAISTFVRGTVTVVDVGTGDNPR
jgi:hypothetical protein